MKPPPLQERGYDGRPSAGGLKTSMSPPLTSQAPRRVVFRVHGDVLGGHRRHAATQAATQAAAQVIQPATLSFQPAAPITHALQVGVGVTAVIVASMTEADFGSDIAAAWRSVAQGVGRSSERWRAASPSTSTGSAAQIQPTAQRKLPCEVVVDVELRTS